MDLTIPAKTLRELVRDFRPVANKTRVLPVLEHVVLTATAGTALGSAGDLTLRGTDLELHLIGKEPCDVRRPGACTVPFALLLQLADKMTADVTLTTNDLDTVMRAGKAKYTLRGLNPQEFPVEPVQPESGGVRLPAAQLAEAIAATSWCALDTEQDGYRGAIHIRNRDSRLALYACDNFRGARWTGESGAPEAFSAVLPKRAVIEVAKLLKDTAATHVDLYGLPAGVGFRIGPRYMTTRSLALEYPNLDQVFPNAFTSTVDVDRATLLGAVERALIVTSSLEARIVNLDLADGQLTINVGSAAVTNGREVLDVDWTAEPFAIRMNGQYLHNMLKAIPVDTLRMCFSGSLQPIITVAPDAPQYTILLMPMNREDDGAQAA